jgi:hypothetical protein
MGRDAREGKQAPGVEEGFPELSPMIRNVPAKALTALLTPGLGSAMSVMQGRSTTRLNPR